MPIIHSNVGKFSSFRTDLSSCLGKSNSSSASAPLRIRKMRLGYFCYLERKDPIHSSSPFSTAWMTVSLAVILWTAVNFMKKRFIVASKDTEKTFFLAGLIFKATTIIG